MPKPTTQNICNPTNAHISKVGFVFVVHCDQQSLLRSRASYARVRPPWKRVIETRTTTRPSTHDRVSKKYKKKKRLPQPASKKNQVHLNTARQRISHPPTRQPDTAPTPTATSKTDSSTPERAKKNKTKQNKKKTEERRKERKTKDEKERKKKGETKTQQKDGKLENSRRIRQQQQQQQQRHDSSRQQQRSTLTPRRSFTRLVLLSLPLCLPPQTPSRRRVSDNTQFLFVRFYSFEHFSDF